MKGFTLIELLAVIVILAIILMIATPMITGVVNTAKTDAQRSSARVWLKEIERQIVVDEINTPIFTWNVTTPAPCTAIEPCLANPTTVVKVKPAPVAAQIRKHTTTGALNGTVQFATGGTTFTIVNGEITN